MRTARLLALVMFVAGGGAVAQEKVENPMYANWAKFKPGTSVTLKSVTAGAMFSTESTITTKLLEVTADKVVLEMSVTSKAGGQDVAIPPTKQEYAKMVELPKGAKKDEFGKKPDGVTNEGTETLKAGGTEIKTKWYEVEVKANGMEIKSKMWMSDDVPGSIVKMETKLSAGSTTMELVEIKKP